MIKISCNNGKLMEEVIIKGSLENLLAETCAMNIFILSILKEEADSGRQIENGELTDIWEVISKTVSDAIKFDIL